MGGVTLMLVVAGALAATESASNQAVRQALAKGEYPWYDAKADALRPVWPPQPLPVGRLFDFSFGRLGLGWPGDSLVIVLLALALTALIAVLVRNWLKNPWRLASLRRGTSGIEGAAARVGSLPAELRTKAADPWAEALRLRAVGDYTGAIICLFAHQLLTLDRLHVIRLAPGRTGRQLVRSVGVTDLREPVAATLRLFESAFYGHRAPTPEAFAAVWSAAEVFERRAAEGLVR
jgi:hypothetical protein